MACEAAKKACLEELRMAPVGLSAADVRPLQQ
jgi:hypothetical protein